MDTAQWPQGIGVVQLPMDGTNNSDGANSDHQTLQQTRPFTTENNIQNKAVSAPRPQKPPAINCPRCHSAHTKFCYYNNYSLSQPRYFCKTCRRYWTEGGSLRNVPVGGGSRKNKRSSSSSSSLSSSLSKKLPDTINSYQNPNLKIFHESQDLNLAYPPNQFVEFTNSPTSYTNFSQFFKSGNNISGGRGFNSFMSVIPGSDSHTSGLIYSSGIPGSGLQFQEFSKTSGLNFSTNQHQLGFDNSGNQGGFGSALQAVHQENNSSSSTNHAKLLNFPIEDLKQPAVVTNTGSTNESEHNGGTGTHHRENDHLQSSGLIWNNGDLGGGASW